MNNYKKYNNNKLNVLVTGSSSGIGLAIAMKFLKHNDLFNVIITGRNTEKLKNLSNLYNCNYYSCDLLYDENINNLYNYIKEITDNNLNILVNNAGIYEYNKIEEINNIKEMIKLNLEVPIILTKKIAKKMKENKYGRIINIGSISGVMGEANASVYSATKAGLIGLTKSLALELAEFNITVNTINPGWVDTSLTDNAFDNSEFTLDQTIDMIPQKRFIHPSEIAELVYFLTTQKARGITGQSINLCAGLSVGF